ncbi:chemotaxis protein CheC [Acetitomaculum ruminis DSM 5522]|uniref:Chemotaxis protein CheC n=1 Tax=Acetitomaculum ruminis DSM 5522 TaxID=1120918 RepID=A0A1I0WWX5_9FIRM|nr:chemotaxis protein CheC [Acetitomaculum ruminis]SFA92670.1 chemotaxis protein CheC [Acetitomaculum ruminis DSM 5522]
MFEISEVHLDALKEVGNIGSGNAATALSSMLNCMVNVTVPDVKIIDYEEAIKLITVEKGETAGIVIDVDVDLKGSMTTIFHRYFVNELLKPFLGIEIDNLSTMEPMAASALCEIGNITTASYVNALAKLTSLTIDIRPPHIMLDEVHNILDAGSEKMTEPGDKVVLIDEHFVIKNVEFQSSMILMLEMESFKFLIKTLGL